MAVRVNWCPRRVVISRKTPFFAASFVLGRNQPGMSKNIHSRADGGQIGPRGETGSVRVSVHNHYFRPQLSGLESERDDVVGIHMRQFHARYCENVPFSDILLQTLTIRGIMKSILE